MKKITLLIILFSATLAANSAQPLKIGYINIGHVLSNSPQFIEAKQATIKEFKPQQDKLIAFQEEMESLIKEFEKNKQNLSESESKSQIEKIINIERLFKQQTLELEQQLKLKKSQTLNKIEDLINQIVEELAKKQKFDLILYQQVAYVDEKIDITSVISEKLRTLFK